jgi:hypothetical protein
MAILNTTGGNLLCRNDYHPAQLVISIGPLKVLKPWVWSYTGWDFFFKNLPKSFSISYWDLIKFLYFADTIERGDRGVKGGPKTGWRQGYFTYFTDNSIELLGPSR